jgi:hypothetical protein
MAEQNQQGVGVFQSGSLGDVEFDVPEVDAALHAVPDVVAHGIDEVLLTTPGPDSLPEDAQLTGPDSPVIEHWHQTAVPNVAVQLADARNERRLLTLIGIGTAATVQLSTRADFSERTLVGAGALPIDVPINPHQQLWLQQTTVANQDIDGYTEVRGPGR